MPHARLMQWLETLGVPIDMQWGIYALYESVSGKVWSPKGLSEAVTLSSDNEKPLWTDIGKGWRKNLPSADLSSFSIHDSVPCQGSYDFDGPVPFGLLTSLTACFSSAHLSGKLSKAG